MQPRNLRLRQLADTAIGEPAGGQLLLYDAAQGRWVPSLAGASSIADGSITTAKLAFDPATQAELDAHTSRTDNPHAVTAAQVAAVAKAGDTMTGNLGLGTGVKLDFADEVKSDKIDLFGGTYLLGIQPSELRITLPSGAALTGVINGTEQLRLRSNGALEHWHPACRAHTNIDLGIATTTYTEVPLNTDMYDPWGMHDTATNTSRIVAPLQGLYLVVGHVIWQAGSQTQRELALVGSDWGELANNIGAPGTTTHQYTQTVAALTGMIAGGTVFMRVAQYTAGTLNLNAAVLSVIYLGRL